jgi:predicted PurR-regulated permease PerM
MARRLGAIGRQRGHWARAQLPSAFGVGLVFGLGLRIRGVPYAVALGVLGAWPAVPFAVVVQVVLDELYAAEDGDAGKWSRIAGKCQGATCTRAGTQVARGADHGRPTHRARAPSACYPL